MASNRTIRLLLSVFLVAAAGQAAARERHVVRRELSAAAASAQAVSRLGAEQRLSFVLVLPLRNQAALTNLLAEIYDPASPRFRQFLTPEQFTAQFGPSEQDYQAALDYAQASGFEVTHQHPNRTMLSLKAPVAQIERAFGVTMRTYRHPSENRVFRAPDADLSLDVAFPILTVCGLDDFSLPRPLNHRRPPRSAIAQATPQAGPGSAPGGAYMGLDFRAAYAPGVTLTGAGQTVGLLQFDGYDPADIAAYKSLAGLPDVPVTNVLLDGFDGSSGDNNDEVCIDIEMAISMAPGLDKVIVYEAGPDGIANDILNQMVTDNAAKQLSASWTWTPRSSSTDAIFLQMAAQGQSFFQASGDWDAYTTIGTVLYPSDNPYVTSVGGTTLTMSGPGGAWESETAWNWGYDSASREYWGTGGGISAAYAIPSWQQGISMTSNRGSTTRRNVPDVALTADNVYVLFGSGSAGVYGGTSCATPLWAGFCALINQQAAINGAAPVGFINPTLYAIGKGANYTTAFHDTTTGNNYWSRSTTKYAAVAGYDLCTGWGTPNGQPLINALTMGFVTLTVQAAYGGAAPGSTNVLAGTALSEWIANSPVVSGATQYICTGATVLSNSFTQVSPTNITLTLTNNATLTWNWQTLYLLTTTTNGPGSVTAGGWRNTGSNAVLTATPGANAYFTGWLGDTNGCVFAGSVLTAPMTQARAITAAFALDTRTLTVVSANDGATPGTVTVNWGTPVSEWVTNSPAMDGTTQYVCVGVSIVGNGFTQISPTNVTLTLTNDASMTWLWTTNYWLGTGTNGPGSVSVASGWQRAGSNVTVVARPSATSHFVQWSGDTNGCLIAFTTLTVPVTRPRVITAVFAAGATPVISGKVTKTGTTTGVPGVTITFSGGAGTVITDGTGSYSNTVPYKWTGTATASFTNGGFATPTITYATALIASQTAKNYVWTPPPTISGKVTKTGTTTGVSGVTITFSGSAGTVITDGTGSYSNTVPYKWTGTATASFTNGGFVTPTITYATALITSQTAKNYVWMPPPTISGKVSKTRTTTGVTNVTITASNNGGATKTDAGGNYVLTVPYGWIGVVTPSLPAGGTFTPASKSYTAKVIASKTAQNFTWTAPVVAIVRQSMTGSAAAVPTTGFVQWAVAYGLVGKPSDLFNQVARSDGMTYGEMYALGTNLATGEPVLRLLAFHGVLTAEVPQQDPATLSDVRVTVEFANDTGSGFWFPAVCLPPLAPVPSTKQWFQAGWGEAADFRVNVQLIQ